MLLATALLPPATAAAKVPKPVVYVPLDRPATPTTPTFLTDPAGVPSDCATDVGPYVAATDGSGAQVTAAFAQAMRDALAEAPQCYPDGPAGVPQAVVHVPPGRYAIQSLVFPSNVRLEVDAGATLQLPPNRTTAGNAATPLIWWDTSTAGAPIDNVSVVGVGSALDDRKQALLDAADPYLAPFTLANYFTMDLDPATTGSTNQNPGINLGNVTHFLVQNVLAVQNDTDQPFARKTPWPTSARSVLSLHANAQSPIGGPFVQPAFGTVADMVTVHSPRGYGPDQINAGTDLDFRNIYGQGGTTLRVETDDSINGKGIVVKGATVDRVTASNIVGVDCNRAVAFAPHAQVNGSVTVDGVWSSGCYEGVSANDDLKLPLTSRGSFAAASVSDLHANGDAAAQLDSTTLLWSIGTSYMTVYVNPRNTWRPTVSLLEQTGTFTNG